jgi:transcriptional regulator with XRE-family HTH domain
LVAPTYRILDIGDEAYKGVDAVGRSGRELDEAFGARLRERRGEMSQEALAERARLSRTSIVNIERGRQGVSLATLYRLAAALNVPPAVLLPPTNATPDISVTIGHASAEETEQLGEILKRVDEEVGPK